MAKKTKAEPTNAREDMGAAEEAPYLPHDEAPVAVDEETRRLAGMDGAEYDATMAKTHNGLEAARAARKNGKRDPNAIRAKFIVVGLNKDGNGVNLLGAHKTKRRAFAWVKENANLLALVCNGTVVYRAKEVKDE